MYVCMYVCMSACTTYETHRHLVYARYVYTHLCSYLQVGGYGVYMKG